MRAKRNCQNCGKSEHMTRVVDAQYGIYDVRHRICYRCHPELDSTSHLNGPDGGLKIMKSDLRDDAWNQLETMPKDMGNEEDDRYADDDTVVNASEMVH